jgi:aspartyl-tRNA(Asn)/glutamyl-tRNA(Gln) amidotransferase subunit B
LEQLEQLRPKVEPIVEGVLTAHPTEVERYRAGQTGKLGFLIGQVMKQVGQSGVKAHPKLVSVMVTEKLGVP